MMGVFPQSFNKTLQADDVKSGFLEKLAQVLGKDMSFFYDGAASTLSVDDDFKKELEQLRKENKEIRAELARAKDPEQPKKESEVYRLWMEHMRITEKMQELYQKEKEG
jgi:hypothetical protein